MKNIKNEELLARSVPFVDLKAQYASMKNEIDEAIHRVIKKTNFILGEEVDLFEKTFARYTDSKYCIGVSSGTEALYLALVALGIGPGDEVITVANTFVATVFAISYTGARPVLIDVNPETYNIDLEKVESKINSKTKAIMPVHLYGRAVDMTKLMDIANKYDLKVVEDACQAHGAVWAKQKVGSFGIIGCFSFYPGKNLGAYGDGGAIVTSDDALHEKLRMIRNYGSAKKYYHDILGYNSRLDTLQASILNAKLKYLDSWNVKRSNNAKLYNQGIQGSGDIVPPGISEAGSHVFHLYVIRTKKRDGLLKYLNENGAQCGIHYPVPIYALGAYANLGLRGEDFPVTEKLSKEILSLPMFPELAENQIGFIADLIKKFYEEGKNN